MAFKDGMGAIAKVFRVLAVGTAVLCFSLGIANHSLGLGSFLAVSLFLFLWTPAWIIRKFIQ